MACPYKPVLSESSSLSQRAPLQSRGKWEDTAAIRKYSLRSEEQSLQGQPALQQLTETSSTPFLTAHLGTTYSHLQAPG